MLRNKIYVALVMLLSLVPSAVEAMRYQGVDYTHLVLPAGQPFEIARVPRAAGPLVTHQDPRNDQVRAALSLSYDQIERACAKLSDEQVFSQHHLYACPHYMRYMESKPQFATYITNFHQQLVRDHNFRKQFRCMPGFDYSFGLGWKGYWHKSKFLDFIGEKAEQIRLEAAAAQGVKKAQVAALGGKKNQSHARVPNKKQKRYRELVYDIEEVIKKDEDAVTEQDKKLISTHQELARVLHQRMEEDGGLMTEDDLADDLVAIMCKPREHMLPEELMLLDRYKEQAKRLWENKYTPSQDRIISILVKPRDKRTSQERALLNHNPDFTRALDKHRTAQIRDLEERIEERKRLYTERQAERRKEDAVMMEAFYETQKQELIEALGIQLVNKQQNAGKKTEVSNAIERPLSLQKDCISDEASRQAARKESQDNPGVVVDYSEKFNAYVRAQNHNAEVFSKRQGSAFDRQIHNELCDTITRTADLVRQHNDNPYIETLAPLTYQFSAAAELEKDPELKTVLADMCHTLLEATEGAARIASTIATNVVTDKLEFVKGMLTSPLQTINKEYIQPVKKIGTLLGKACYLACTDPERLRNGAVARFNQVLSAAKTNPEAFIVAAGELLGNNVLKKIANLQTLQKAAKAAGRGNRFGKVVTEVGKKSQEAKEVIAYPLTAIAEKAKNKCNEALRKGKQQKPQKAINKPTTGPSKALAGVELDQKALADRIRKVDHSILDQMEAAGGHTLLKHQNQTNQKLTRRAIKEPANASTFTDKKTALKAVQENLRNNADAIAEWIKEHKDKVNAATKARINSNKKLDISSNPILDPAKNNKIFKFVHKLSLGRGISKETRKVENEIHESLVCLQPDLQSRLGFKIVTAHPALKGRKK